MLSICCSHSKFVNSLVNAITYPKNNGHPLETSISSGKFVKMLTQVPNGKSTAEHLAHLQGWCTAASAFTNSMALPKRVLEDCICMVKLMAEILGSANGLQLIKDQVVCLQEKFKTFEPNYHPDFQNRSHL